MQYKYDNPDCPDLTSQDGLRIQLYTGPDTVLAITGVIKRQSAKHTLPKRGGGWNMSFV